MQQSYEMTALPRTYSSPEIVPAGRPGVTNRRSPGAAAPADAESDDDAASTQTPSASGDESEDDDDYLEPELDHNGRVHYSLGAGAARRVLLDQDPALNMQWDVFWRASIPQAIWCLAMAFFAYETQFPILTYGLLAMGVALPVFMVILRVMQSQFLLILFLAINVAAMFFTAYFAVGMINDLVACGSPHCQHGHKWLYATLFIGVWFLLGVLVLENRNALVILSAYNRNYAPAPLGPAAPGLPNN
jgi:hypothetical protein